MTKRRFEWHKAKSRSNERKHGVSFEDARSMFESGVEYLERFDESHSATEDRFLAIGPIHRGLITVAWTEMADGTIRIISARMATRREAELFGAGIRG